ncbi:hypothetical protein SAMN05443574_1407 [Haloarcula vallismortis]|uniref:Uncharacterized protein n=2 Tax=Haloarcula vallismortis TaxID=28442 RepID=M0JAL0_HALVA|nr:hypothetical protein [Haloarcula vallismortis]EMA06157.1 hypothetical protein C437_12241 [Haloarcula vallismortis ATCC 29715]SDX38162.1 hypothetical protein SAMN05443574_1407 [Haloarcula vallismortis]
MNTDVIKDKVLFWKDYFPTKAVIWRKRGSTWVPQFTEAARLKYDDQPNAHVFRTGDETKAVPLDYVETTSTGQDFLMVAEVEDDDFVPVKFDLNGEGDIDLKKEELDGSQEQVGSLDALALDNRDERLNFYTSHLEKSESKYTVPGFLAENERLVLVVTTALAVAIILFAFGQQFADALPVLRDISDQLPGLADAIQNSGTGSTPPGS